MVVQLFAEDLLEEAWDASQAHFAREPVTGRLVAAMPPLLPPGRRGLLSRAAHEFANLCGLTRFTALRLLELREWVRREPPWFRASGDGAGGPAAPATALAFPVEEELEALVAAYDGRVTLLLLEPYDPRGLAPAAETDERIARFAVARGVSLVRLRDGFAGLRESGRAPYGFAGSGFNRGHLNAVGHRLAARLLADELDRVLGRHGLH